MSLDEAGDGCGVDVEPELAGFEHQVAGPGDPRLVPDPDTHLARTLLVLTDREAWLPGTATTSPSSRTAAAESVTLGPPGTVPGGDGSREMIAMSGQAEQVQRIVGISALVIGVGNILSSRLSGRFWDIPADAAPVVPHLARIYGVTLAGLGAQTLMMEERHRRDALRLGAAVGLGTAVVDVASWSRGRLGRRGAVTGGLAAGGLGVLCWIGSQE